MLHKSKENGNQRVFKNYKNMEDKKFENYSKEVNGQVRKYFDDNNIEICFRLESWALKDDFEKGVSIEDSAKSFIEELLED